jgi:hypothetical protein
VGRLELVERWQRIERWVSALTVYDDGRGPALYAGGDGYVARWDGSSWAPLGSLVNRAVSDLAVYDDGAGPALYWGGRRSPTAGILVSDIAKWDGSSWVPLGDGLDGRDSTSVGCLAVYDGGDGPALYAAGFFLTAGEVAVKHIAKWNGSSWAALGGGISGVSFPEVRALAVYDDGGGPALYAGGEFTSAGGTTANRIAKWDGSSWSALGVGLKNSVYSAPTLALTAHDDGTGPALYAGGFFRSAGGSTANYIARWNGSSWSALGGGMNGPVGALATYDDGGGPALYAGGAFTRAGGVPANYIARWDGSSWSALGSGMDHDVEALAVYDDGSGPALYAGGSFARGIARWDGSSWSRLGGGMGGTNPYVMALAVYDDGGGPALYAAGSFTSAGGVTANRIAKWNGSSWSALGDGLSGGGSYPFFYSLATYDDGHGPALYAGGAFTAAGGAAVNWIAKWDGSSWSALGSGMNGVVHVLAPYDDGSGPALYAGGTFSVALDSGDSYIAKWGYPAPDFEPPTLSCPPSVLVLDSLGGPPGEIVTFSVTASDCRDSSPRVVCVPPSGSFFPRGTTLVRCKATDSSGNRTTCEFPVTVVPKSR